MALSFAFTATDRQERAILRAARALGITPDQFIRQAVVKAVQSAQDDYDRERPLDVARAYAAGTATLRAQIDALVPEP